MLEGLGHGFGNMRAAGDGQMQSYSSSYSYSSHGDGGQKRVVEHRTSHRAGPGQVEERQEQSKDSATGIEKLSVQRQIGNRARKITRGRNMHSGEETCDDALVNMRDDEAEKFDAAWKNASAALPAGACRGIGGNLEPQTFSRLSQPTHAQKRPHRSRMIPGNPVHENAPQRRSMPLPVAPMLNSARSSASSSSRFVNPLTTPARRR